MVAPLTDPAWTPLFLAVDGVVVNVGASKPRRNRQQRDGYSMCGVGR